MDPRSSKLIASLYLGLALIVTLTVFFGYRRYRLHLDRWDLASSSSSGVRSSGAGARIQPSSRSSLPGRVEPTSEQMRTIRQLRDLLDKRTSSLQQQKAQLQKRNDELESLRAETDEYLALLLSILLQEGGSNSPSEEPIAAVASTPGPSNSALDDSAARERQAAELARARAELERAQSRIGELELSLLQELEMSSEATSLLVATGAPAVPALITVLSDGRPEVRRWAATVLGQIGADAVEAELALERVLDDPDSEVRSAAAWALRQINDG